MEKFSKRHFLESKLIPSLRHSKVLVGLKEFLRIFRSEATINLKCPLVFLFFRQSICKIQYIRNVNLLAAFQDSFSEDYPL